MANYVGNKNFSNVIHFLINRLPKSERYFSLFFGGGGLETCKYTDEAFFICAEKDNDIINTFSSSVATIDFNCYKDLLEEIVFTRYDFIFADPPYMFSSRFAGRKYYKHEFSDNDHVEFLKRIKDNPAKVLITHPECDLYNEYLEGWHKEYFYYMTRKGEMFKDCVYMNYDPKNIELLNYECLGVDFIDRQRIKRQRKNMISKIHRLDPHIKKAILSDIKKEFFSTS